MAYYNARIKKDNRGKILEVLVADNQIFSDEKIKFSDLADNQNFDIDTELDIIGSSPHLVCFDALRPVAELRSELECENMTEALFERIESNEAFMRNLKEKICREASARRAKRKIFDYAACNDFDYFITLTLDKKKIVRNDWELIVPKLNTWLSNRVQRNGYRYIIAPEWHKNRLGMHFHGLLSGDKIGLAETGKFDSAGHEIFNLTDWKYGFTTAIQTYGDRTNVAKYITKYICKDSEKIGGRWYLHSNNLESPIYQYENFEFDSLDGENVFKVHCPSANIRGIRY
jgi:hypothetical protein